MGIYTTRDLKQEEHILAAPDGPSITLLAHDFRGHSSKFPKSNWLDLWGEYAWGRGKGVPDHVSYEDSAIMEFQITTGALPNHHCILDAIDAHFPDIPFDDSLVEHRQSPGTGAFSYNRGRDFFVGRKLKAGDEIFLNYGHCSHEDNPEWAEGFPMPSDFTLAIQFISNIQETAPDKDGKVAFPPDMDPLVAQLVPKTFEDLRELMSHNYEPSELNRELARRTGINQRTPEWIREHGKCLEHLVPGPSGLPYAGLGGIAQHFIARGGVVVPAPVVHIMDRDVLSVYDDEGRKIGDQVLLNYCFGHRESTLLLCPNTNAILINHCGRRTKNCRPNAEVRWSNGWDTISDEWREESLGELSKKPYRGLSMEIVALRDIAPDEEVFLDYGNDWDEAWKNHLTTWKPPGLVMSAKEANDQDAPPDFLVSGDLRTLLNDEGKHLFAGCQYWLTEWDEDEIWGKNDSMWKNRTDREILKLFADDGSDFAGSYAAHKDMSYWPCIVIRPEDETDSTYTVRIIQSPFEENQPWATNNLPRFLTNYPRESIHFFVRKSAGDQYLPGVFRHKIGIPDDIFPEHWKNLASY